MKSARVRSPREDQQLPDSHEEHVLESPQERHPRRTFALPRVPGGFSVSVTPA